MEKVFVSVSRECRVTVVATHNVWRTDQCTLANDSAELLHSVL
jgi:hypothetical protein